MKKSYLILFMEKSYQNVRNWLLSNDRYEDVVKFDKSDEAKEAFQLEMFQSKMFQCNNYTGTRSEVHEIFQCITLSEGEIFKIRKIEELKEEEYTPIDEEEFRIKKFDELKEEVYKDCHSAIELANKSPEQAKTVIMELLDIIIRKEGIISVQKNVIYTMRKNEHQGEE